MEKNKYYIPYLNDTRHFSLEFIDSITNRLPAV